MKAQIFLLILFAFLVNDLTADIVSRLAEIDEENRIVLYKEDGYYAAMYTLSGENMRGDNYLQVTSFEDTLGPGIMAYLISGDTVKLVIKDRDICFYETNGSFEYYDEVVYFFAEFREVNGEIQYTCKKINQLNLNGFTFNNSFIVDEDVEVSLEPSPDSEIYCKLNMYDHPDIELVEISPESIKAGMTNDFWYKIKYDHKILWVNGAYVHFGEMIKLP
jgi:hypothetical protein